MAKTDKKSVEEIVAKLHHFGDNGRWFPIVSAEIKDSKKEAVNAVRKKTEELTKEGFVKFGTIIYGKDFTEEKDGVKIYEWAQDRVIQMMVASKELVLIQE